MKKHFYFQKVKASLFFMLVLFCNSNFAQNISLIGTVSNSKNEGIQGVSVTLSGTKKGTTTDENGKFKLEVINLKGTLEFKHIAYITREIPVNGEPIINAQLTDAVTSLNDVIITGYGSQKKVDLTGAVATLKSDKIDQLPTTSLSNSLAGRLSGVYVMQSTGVPGISADVRVRSDGSWNNTAPLYVIDGIVLDKSAFDRLDPSEIAEFSVLKDAASAAIYGSRAAAGVILVTTKRGRSGKPVISYSGSYSSDKPTSLPKIMDPITEGIPFINNAFSDPTHWAHWSPQEIEGLKKQGGWISPLDNVYRTPNINRHTLNVSGGNDNMKFFIGGSYANQKGYLPNLDYQKYNLRGNVEAKVAKNLTASLQISTNYDQRSKFNWNPDDYRTGQGINDLNQLWGWLIAAYGYMPAYIDGKPTDNGWVANLTDRFYQGYQHFSGQSLDALATLKYDVPFIKGLSLKASFSKDNYYGYNKRYDVNHLMYQFKPIEGSSFRIFTDTVIGSRMSQDPGTEYLENDWNRRSAYQLNGQTTYTRDFGKHHFDAFVVYEQSEWNTNYLNGKRKNFPVVRTAQFWAAGSDTKGFELNGGEDLGARLSYVGKINYSYADKYLLSASLRRDGSLGFAQGKRWGTFPAIAAGWRISEERFMKDKIHFLDYLKLRASYGVTGSDAVGGWQWQDQYYLDRTYILGGQPTRGINIGGVTNGRYYNVSNNNLTWEKSTSYNFGLDTRLFNTLNFTTEYWFRNTTDILGGRNASYPAEAGIYPADENYGKVNSHGFEIELGYEGKVGSDFRYSITGNFAYATNKVILRDVAQNAQSVDNPNGKTLGYFTGLESTGVIRTQKELDALPADYTINGYIPQLGMLNYRDLSGPNGKPDNKIDNYDRAVIAKYSSPPYSGGLALSGYWKGISLDVFLQGNFGAYKLMDDGMAFRQADTYDMPWKFWLDSWTPKNPKGKYPQQIEQWAGVQSSDVQDSDFWLFSTSYVRLKQVSLGYALPKTFITKAGLQNVKLLVTGTNLLTWSKSKLYDPELASYSSYPIMKTITFGLNITL